MSQKWTTSLLWPEAIYAPSGDQTVARLYPRHIRRILPSDTFVHPKDVIVVGLRVQNANPTPLEGQPPSNTEPGKFSHLIWMCPFAARINARCPIYRSASD